MTVTLGQLTGQGATREIDGTEYNFAPLTLADIGAMQQWATDLPMERAQAHIKKYGELYGPEERREITDKARKEYEERQRVFAGLEPDDEVVNRIRQEINAEFNSLAGVARMVFLSLKKYHPEITEDQAHGIIDAYSLAAIKDIIDSASLPQRDEDEDLVLTEEEKKTQDGEAS